MPAVQRLKDFLLERFSNPKAQEEARVRKAEALQADLDMLERNIAAAEAGLDSDSQDWQFGD